MVQGLIEGALLGVEQRNLIDRVLLGLIHGCIEGTLLFVNQRNSIGRRLLCLRQMLTDCSLLGIVQGLMEPALLGLGQRNFISRDLLGLGQGMIDRSLLDVKQGRIVALLDELPFCRLLLRCLLANVCMVVGVSSAPLLVTLQLPMVFVGLIAPRRLRFLRIARMTGRLMAAGTEAALAAAAGRVASSARSFGCQGRGRAATDRDP